MDRAAAEQLYRRLGGVVLRRAEQLLGDSAAARDVLQDVFTRVIASEQSLEAIDSPVAWLYQITTRCCLNHLNAGARRGQLLSLHASRDERSARPDVDDRLTVAQLLRSVPEALQEIAILYYVDQLSHEEIARQIGTSRRTVGNRLEEFRALARAGDVTLPEVA